MAKCVAPQVLAYTASCMWIKSLPGCLGFCLRVLPAMQAISSLPTEIVT